MSLRRLYSTVNNAEIAHFSKLSAHWWDEHGEFAFLHKMNPARVQFIQQKLKEIHHDDHPGTPAPSNSLKGLDALDIGCGGGLLSESLARLGANTLGIDASESNISIASHHASHDPKLSRSLEYQHTTSESLLDHPKRYDIVCSMEVLEHVNNPALFLDTCAQLVKPGGHLFLSTIARTPLSDFLTIFLAEHVLRKVTVGTHTHSKFINSTELVSFFQKYPRSKPKTESGSSSGELSTSPSDTDTVPWISPHSPANEPMRTQAEIRGLIYNPLQANWYLAPRGAWAAAECNYLFWVRKPLV
ncbi:ubiquinone biosynthesis O-methyltransferase [Pluteus cervinus]|uniref:Ubiquinone biosynthesis O-methyltransferase n=1 Tax=Pluteus cervinus TaxID=181527 RepID=A0ACD3B7S8_9AGAR|nr:ubiquinone biosynthesis O-methyltransferase [Pluteus cervinus]